MRIASEGKQSYIESQGWPDFIMPAMFTTYPKTYIKLTKIFIWFIREFSYISHRDKFCFFLTFPEMERNWDGNSCRSVAKMEREREMLVPN